MKMLFIAENLKALRKAEDMTQEDVAGILGVSPQSVSKWERGDTYPDITFLPSLANLFKTSVDALIGMAKLNDNEARTAVFIEGQKRMLSGDDVGAAAVYSEALKTYPDDENIMLELALVLAQDSETANLQRAVVLCERILAGKPSENVQYTTRAALCYLLLKTGRPEEANLTAQKLPHLRVCRETVLELIDKGPDTDEINACLSRINFRDDAATDILVIDFGLDMLPIVKEHDLLDRISKVRKSAGKGQGGRHALPAVRIRDNTDLAPSQVRVRYVTQYLLDKCYSEPREAADEVIGTLQNIAKGNK